MDLQKPPPKHTSDEDLFLNQGTNHEFNSGKEPSWGSVLVVKYSRIQQCVVRQPCRTSFTSNTPVSARSLYNFSMYSPAPERCATWVQVA
ncbi:hypothetical protein BDZ94DRAFT_1069096 [Collybia nuda]|uniref:Uncharacterized protein n=1 Tax=Collybia nuda TaxID=64659 RepID=A0A9P6CFF8_9AGAR|nr:hypothetical protein BDZ94DRAFT_1069096 [Collybia nuda]